MPDFRTESLEIARRAWWAGFWHGLRHPWRGARPTEVQASLAEIADRVIAESTPPPHAHEYVAGHCIHCPAQDPYPFATWKRS